MNMRLEKNQLNSVTVEAISSKSHVHRLLVAAALSENLQNPCLIRSNIVSNDMKATVDCLGKLGAQIDITEEGFCVRRPVSVTQEAHLDCGESGSTARFLLPLSIVYSNKVILNGGGKLPSRPFSPLCDSLRNAGACISSDFLPLTATGELRFGEYRIAGDVSSQYISGLLFALPLLDGDSRIILTTTLESKGYVDLTIDVLRLFGIQIDRLVRKDGGIEGFFVPGRQCYAAPREINAEGDWSNGGFLLCAGTLGGGITVKGLNPDSTQKDSETVKILEKFGADIFCDYSTSDSINNKTAIVTVKPSSFGLTGVDIDAGDIPDMVPALALVAAYAKGSTTFRNVGRLRIKESDRIEALQVMLEQIGVKTQVSTAGERVDLAIEGKAYDGASSGKSCEVLGDCITIDGYNDHRIVMAASYIALRENIPVEIIGANAVNKSYPGYFDVIKNMGLTVTER